MKSSFTGRACIFMAGSTLAHKEANHSHDTMFDCCSPAISAREPPSRLET